MSSERRVVGTHFNPHNDEAVMLLLAEVAGWDVQTVRFFRTGAAAIAAQQAEPSMALFGIGGREDVDPGMIVVDEHQPGGRVAGECGATLLAKHLGIADQPELAEILAYAYRADTTGGNKEEGQRPFELAEMMKTLHGYSDLGDENVWLKVVRPCYRAVLAHARGDAPRPMHTLSEESFWGSDMPAKGASIRKIVLPEQPNWEVCVGLWAMLTLGADYWKIDRKVQIVFTDDASVADEAARGGRRGQGSVVLGIGLGDLGDATPDCKYHAECLPVRIAKAIGGDVRKGAAKMLLGECERWYADASAVLPFELSTLVERLRTHGELDSKGILEIVQIAMQSRYARSEEFFACSKVRHTTQEVGGVKVVLVKTDNPQAAGYFRGKRGDVVVIRKASGNANIFVTNEMKASVLPALCRALIVAESNARGEGDLIAQRLAALEAAGDEAMKGFALLGNGDETWYVSYAAVHNGTTTHPDVSPTKLTAEAIFQVAQEAVTSTRA